MRALTRRRSAFVFTSALLIQACASIDTPAPGVEQFVGTHEPFAAEAVYFVLTDRYADGDPTNNFPEQGGPFHTFNRPVVAPNGVTANIGYLGGDFKGLADHAEHIAQMGFTAVWLSPIVDNPDQAFRGGSKIGEGIFTDHGKTGYHGYWGVNFFEVDEHLESDGLTFADLTQRLDQGFGLKTVLDIVCNHGSPSFSMPEDQPLFGELYDAQGTLVADHANLHPTNLDPDEPLQRWFHRETDIAELSNLDDTSPQVLDYMVEAYSKWMGQGAAAFRIDTIRHMPHAFWKRFSDRIREQQPGFFMFGEHFSFEADAIAEHTFPQNGNISVLDFPGREQMTAVFGENDQGFELLESYLHLTDGTYHNPYDLMTFYDNHDMPRMKASDQGFIDAHNWLFTSRGIPVVYYGSEVGFMAGAKEHEGNRNFFGADRIAASERHPIRQNLTRIATVRKHTPALQRGLQANITLEGDKAIFLRVFESDDQAQTALVLLNKGDEPATMTVEKWLSAGRWDSVFSDSGYAVSADSPGLEVTVPAHGVEVLVYAGRTTNMRLQRELRKLMAPLPL